MVIVDDPSFELADDMYIMPGTPLICCSSSLSDLMGGTITICVRIAELIRA
jgi:hypothetical protein